jgi:hypothetical protein
VLFAGFLVASGPSTPTALPRSAVDNYELASETTSTMASATRAKSSSSIT